MILFGFLSQNVEDERRWPRWSMSRGWMRGEGDTCPGRGDLDLLRREYESPCAVERLLIDMEAALLRGMVKRCPSAVAVGHRFDRRSGGGGDERVGFRRGVRVIFAGWLPQDGLFGVSAGRGLGQSSSTAKVQPPPVSSRGRSRCWRRGLA